MTLTCIKKSSKVMPPVFIRASISSACSLDRPESSAPPGIMPPRPFDKKSGICMLIAARATRPEAGAARSTGWKESSGTSEATSNIASDLDRPHPWREGIFLQRGQLIGGAQAPVPVFVPHADFFQFQAGAGRAAAARGAG